jgi:Fe-S-cluster containining protein
MTACSSCGGCCSPVSLAWTQDDVRRMMPFQIDDRTRRWVLEELHPLTRREARPTYYRCDNYDPGTRQCTAYDDRPGVCRDHPTYGQPVNPGASLPPGCSYRADIGQPVDPDWTPVTLRAP